MTLEAFMSIVPPPKKPREVRSDRNWLEVERSLGTRLPSDYKGYVEKYGTGELGGCVWVYDPFSIWPSQNLLVQVPIVLDHWRAIREEFGEEEIPYPLYPEPDGLLPWGHFDTGAELFWQTSGDPEEWTVVANESRGPEFEAFNESMTGFLEGLFTRRIKSEVLPLSLLRRGRKFIPLKE